MDRTASLYTRMICTALFCTFSLVYLYSFQSDILYRLQHAASGGRTFYVPAVGALLITAVLKLLQIGVYAVTRLYKRWYAITYLPSCLIITFLTSVSVGSDGTIDAGVWKWLAPLLISVYVVVVWIAKSGQTIEPSMRSVGLLSQLVWINVLQLIVMFMVVVLFGIHDEPTHLQAHGQRIIYTNVRRFTSNRIVVDGSAEKKEKKRGKKAKAKEEKPVENTDSLIAQCS